jgi:hypothetical protein
MPPISSSSALAHAEPVPKLGDAARPAFDVSTVSGVPIRGCRPRLPNPRRILITR